MGPNGNNGWVAALIDFARDPVAITFGDILDNVRQYGWVILDKHVLLRVILGPSSYIVAAQVSEGGAWRHQDVFEKTSLLPAPVEFRLRQEQTQVYSETVFDSPSEVDPI